MSKRKNRRHRPAAVPEQDRRSPQQVTVQASETAKRAAIISDHEPFLGIDFGTAYSAMAWVHPDSGQADILCNAEGEEKTRSAVYFAAEGAYVGRLAEEYLEDETEAARVLLSVKRELAKKIVCGVVGGKPVTPLDVAVKIFGKLKSDAEKTNFHRPVRRAVVTVPASFDPLEKEAIGEAARQAGFDEVKLLEEPVAAAIAYLKAGLDVGRRILVFDLGAGTFDTAILDREEDDVQPFHLALQPRGEQKGGDDFDRALMNHILEGLPQAAADRTFIPHLLYRCRRLKETLSHRESHVLSVMLPGGSPLRKEVTRATFEGLIASAVTSMVRLSAELAEQAAKDGGPPDTLVLIGGSARIPFVGRALAESLPLTPRPWHHQDVAVALGAAYYGEIFWGARAAKKYRETLRRMARDKDTGIGALRSVEQERHRLDLSAKQAEKIEREELGDTLGGRLTAQVSAATDDYREAVRRTLANEFLEVAHLDLLSQTAERLGLSRNEAAKIEREILGDAKEIVFDRQRAERSERAHAILTKAREFFKAGELDEALAHAQAACDANPQLSDGYLFKTEILAKKEKWELAESAASAYLRLRPNDSAMRYQRGRFRLEAKKYQEALGDFDEVLQSDLSGDRWRYRWRAVARCHLGDARGALADLDLAAKDPGGCRHDGTPVAAMWTMCGLFRNRSNNSTSNDPEMAFLCFSRALAQLDAQEVESWRSFIGWFGFRDVPGSPVLFLQKRLWQLSKELHRNDRLAAVDSFAKAVTEAGQDIQKEIWQAEKGFGIRMVKIHAALRDTAGCKTWISRLVKQFDLDVTELQKDSDVSACKELVDYLSPRWSYTEDHGVFFNQLTVKNESPFSLHNVVVSIAVHGNSPTKMEERVSRLGPGEQQQWQEVFKNGGFLGGNINFVKVQVRCRQGEAELTPEGRAYEEEKWKAGQSSQTSPTTTVSPKPNRASSSSESSEEWKWVGPGIALFFFTVVLPWLRGCGSEASGGTEPESRVPAAVESVETIYAAYRLNDSSHN